MECRFCKKGFSKGEHLRRHERSRKNHPSQVLHSLESISSTDQHPDHTHLDTGYRPFVCKICSRPFARQDSLIRHNRLNSCLRRESREQSVPSRPDVAPIQEQLPPPYTTPVSSGGGGGVTVPTSNVREEIGSPYQPMWAAEQEPTPSASSQSQNSPQAPEFDFDLIWPDSEDLIHSILSSDNINQWQMPLGLLPSPPVLSKAYSGNNYGGSNSFVDRVSSIGAIPSGGSHQAIHNVSKMVTNVSSNVTSELEALSITSVLLDQCLHMFFVRFVPTFPVLHRATFVFRDHIHPLLLNAIAIGSLYIGPKDAIRKGEALWRLAHTAVTTSWEKLITHRGPFDSCNGVQLVLAALLGQVYGSLSKNRDIRTASQAFHALGFYWARHCGMFDSESYSLNNLPSADAPEAIKEQQWRVWVAREIQQRALLGHYVVDGLSARMFGRPNSTYHAANKLSLPSTEAAFEASTADEWLAHMRSQQITQSSFRYIIRSLFLSEDESVLITPTLSTFSLRVVLEGLQSLVTHCDNDDITIGIPKKSEVRYALAQVHSRINISVHSSNSDMQETLLRWHAICLDACVDSIALCKYICSYYGVKQNVWGGGHGMQPGFDIYHWVTTQDAHRALLHAISIQEIIENLPRGRAHVLHIPSSLFAAATVYSVFSLAGISSVNIPRIVEWKDVLCESLHGPGGSIPGEPAPATMSETRKFVCGEFIPMFGTASRNLLYELNSMQKLFRCLSSQWGISHDMEEVIDQWITLCH